MSANDLEKMIQKDQGSYGSCALFEKITTISFSSKSTWITQKTLILTSHLYSKDKGGSLIIFIGFILNATFCKSQETEFLTKGHKLCLSKKTYQDSCHFLLH